MADYPNGPPYKTDNDCDLYDNAGINNLSPVSVVSNEIPPMNIVNVPIKKRRKSLYMFQKNLEEIQRKIHERLSGDDNVSNKDVFKSKQILFERFSSQTDLKQKYNDESDKHTIEGRANDIYSTRIQEGDNNLMLVCEPKTRKSCCYKQIGNNNIMLNLHMSMMTNSCQILEEDTGNVFKLDSAGEVWLEIKVRRNKLNDIGRKKSNDRLSSCSSVSSDSNSSQEYFTCQENHSDRVSSPVGSKQYNIPTDHVGNHSPSLVRDEFISHLNNLSGATAQMLGHTPDEYHRSGHRCGEEGDDDTNCTVHELHDSIFVQVETPERLSDYDNLDECKTWKETLERPMVKDFLEKQTNTSDFDVSIIEWEYEPEPLYSIANKGEYENQQDDDPVYTKIVRKPTIPPRPYRSPCEHEEGEHPRPPCTLNIMPDKGSERNTKTVTPPAIKPKPKVHRDMYGKTRLTTSLSYEDTAQLRKCPTTNQGALASPGKELPTPPGLLKPLPNVGTLSLVLPRDHEPGKSAAQQRDKSRSPARELPPPPSPKPKPPPTPTKERQLCATWYHEQIDYVTSKALLSGKTTGSFIVRNASDSSGEHKYTLEFVDGDAVRRLKIMKTGGKYHLKESEMNFDTVNALVEEALKTGIEVRGDRNATDWRMIKISPIRKS